MNKPIAILLAVVVAAGAGWYLLGRDGAPGRGHVEVELVVEADAPLAFVPADTPFVVANLTAPPADLIAHWEQQMGELSGLWAAQFAQLRDTFGVRISGDPRVVAVLDELEQILAGKTPREVAAELGVGFDARIAIYALGALPVLRIELADPGALVALIERLERAYGEPLPQAELDGQRYWLLGGDPTPLAAVAAIVDRHLVLSLAPKEAPDALRQILGLQRPARSLADSGELQALNRQFGYAPYLSAYLHSSRLLDALTGPASALDRALLAAIEIEKPVLDATCAAEWRALAEAWPRLSFGYTRLDGKQVDTLGVLETRADIAASLQKLRAPVPGLAALGSEVIAHLGIGLRVGAVPEVVADWAEQVRADPWQCESLTPLNEAIAQAHQQVINPALYAVAPMASAVHVAVTELALDDLANPQFAGWLVVGSDNPAGLAGMAQMVAPGLAQLQLQADGQPRPLPPNPAWPIDQPIHVAMTDGAFGIAVGAGQEQALPAAMRIDPARQPLLVGGVDASIYRMLGEQIAQAVPTTPGQTPEQQARAARDAELMQRLYSASFQRMGFSLEFTARGIEFSQQVTLP
jgi:hypothetical protein